MCVCVCVQLELRRVQQKNRATEEMLVADMAEQCAEDEEEALQYYITQERCATFMYTEYRRAGNFRV